MFLRSIQTWSKTLPQVSSDFFLLRQRILEQQRELLSAVTRVAACPRKGRRGSRRERNKAPYNALQTWAVSVGPEATGSSDLAALVCRVATVVDPRGRNEKLHELKSSLETHLEKTQIELALSQLRALVQVDPVSNVEEVSVALDKCKKWRSHQTWRTSWSLSKVGLCHTLSNR